MTEQELIAGLEKGVLNGTVVDGYDRIVEMDPNGPGPAPLSDAERTEMQARQADLIAMKIRLADLCAGIANAEKARNELLESIRAEGAALQRRAETFGAARNLGPGWQVDFATGAWKRTT